MDLLDKEKIYVTGKSASIRLKNSLWNIDFEENFEDVVENIHLVLITVDKMYELSTKIDSSCLY